LRFGIAQEIGLLTSVPYGEKENSPPENWCHWILETKDNLESALEFLLITYIEILAGRPVKSGR